MARGYHDVVVGPLVRARWPGLRYAAGRLGSGSEVLGLDDDMSRDHDWGLRLTLLVPPGLAVEVENHLDGVLPDSHAGFPTRFAVTGDPVIRHRVEVTSAEEFVAGRLGLVNRPGVSGDSLV